MRRFLVLMMALLLAGLSFTDDAEARRRGGFSFGGSKAKTRSVPVVIPIPGGSSSVVFVKELPNIAAFKFQDQGFYDLGYKFGTFGGGAWVGYFKSRSGYVELDQALVKQHVLPMVGLTEADTPTRGAGSQAMVGIWWLVAAVCAAGFLMLRVPLLLRALAASRGRTRIEDDIETPRYNQRFAAPEPFFQPKPSLAAAPRAQAQAPAFGRAAPAGAFGKRR